MHMARSGSIKEGNRHQEAPMLDDHARLSRVGVNVARITGPAKPQPKTSNHRTDPFLIPSLTPFQSPEAGLRRGRPAALVVCGAPFQSPEAGLRRGGPLQASAVSDARTL